ncbi:MAG TPA: hypothetical protein VHE99_05165 [Gammaproteobacteria bacterium]|nr:hypothetical protein [Gammaproteobacteria bacterium]
MLITPSRKNWYRLLLIMVFFAFLSAFFMIFLPHIKEEGRYTIASMEMFYNHYYWQPTTYGAHYRRPPFFNWLTLPIMHWIGAQNVLVASRIVAASGTVLLALMLWFFSLHLFKNKVFAIFSVAVLFSGDFLLGKAWVAYPDTWFAFFTFTAISCMWISIKEQRPLFWIPIPFVLFAALLTKAFTCYIFYATALLVVTIGLGWSKNWRYLLKPASILAHALVIILPLTWFLLPESTGLAGMLGDVSGSMAQPEQFTWLGYFLKILSTPFSFIYLLLPIDILVLYCLYRYKKYPTIQPVTRLDGQSIKLLIWIIVLSILPYWFSTAHLLNPRYLFPLLPMIAIVLAYCVWRAGEKMVGFAILILIFELFLKCILVILISHPGKFTSVDFSLDQIANDALKQSQSYANLIYVSDFDDGGYGVNIASKINIIRWPQPPLTTAPEPLTKGCVLSQVNSTKWGVVPKVYHVNNGRGKPIYVYCK